MSEFKPLEIFPYPTKGFRKLVNYCIPDDVDSLKSLLLLEWKTSLFKLHQVLKKFIQIKLYNYRYSLTYEKDTF
jgi:hypothetical protein